MSNTNKTVLVTGGAGFIGSNLVPILLMKGYKVVVLDNLSSGRIEDLDLVHGNPNFTFIQGDIRNQVDIRHSMKGVDRVVHLAALIDVVASFTDPTLTNEVNVTGTLNVLQEAANAGVDNVVFASSTAVYGDTSSSPVKEETILKPISPYAASKVAGEAYCNTFANNHRLGAIVLRFFNVYGPKNVNSPYSGVIPKFLRKATMNEVLTVDGDGEQTRDFIYVSDVAKALSIALEKDELRGDVFNVCTGVPTSINKLVETVRIVLGKDLHIKRGKARKGDIRFSYGDTSKAWKVLGFRAEIAMQQGLIAMLDNDKQCLS